MKERFRGVDEVRESVLGKFTGLCPLHDFHLLPQRDVDFRAYIFFERHVDVDACEADGISREIVDYVYSELERVGRGGRKDIVVAFEFDSDEDVKANFEGNYFLRLR